MTHQIKRFISFIKNNNSLIFTLFIVLFFYYLSSKTPLAGDDWGYALNGMKHNPFELAYEFYFTWSGRFFSELYGFLVTPNKWLWNFLNAGLFGLIFYSILKISGLKNSIVASLLVLFLIISVKDELRMETYTWLMGTTYLIPLALSLFYFSFVLKNIETFRRINKLMVPVLWVILLVSCMMMENAAVILVFGNFLICVYLYFRDRTIPMTSITFFVVSLIGLILLRLSPGASARLIRDHSEWVKLSIIDQLIFNYPNFIRLTFIEHRYLVLVFSGLSFIKLVENWFKTKSYSFLHFILMIFFVISAFSSLTLTLYSRFPLEILNMFINPDSLFNLVFWPLFILAVFAFIYTMFEETIRLKLFFFVLLAGISNGVMMLSPIFGYRSSLYTVYFLIVMCLIIYSSLNRTLLSKLLIVPLIVLCYVNVNQLMEKYNLVESVHNIRLGQIEYYKDNPKIKDIWLIRYPIYTIHGGDIEVDDSYHMEVFKEYYGLNKDAVLNFYFPEEGY
jgi:hypothetical protein